MSSRLNGSDGTPSMSSISSVIWSSVGAVSTVHIKIIPVAEASKEFTIIYSTLDVPVFVTLHSSLPVDEDVLSQSALTIVGASKFKKRSAVFPSGSSAVKVHVMTSPRSISRSNVSPTPLIRSNASVAIPFWIGIELKSAVHSSSKKLSPVPNVSTVTNNVGVATPGSLTVHDLPRSRTEQSYVPELRSGSEFHLRNIFPEPTPVVAWHVTTDFGAGNETKVRASNGPREIGSVGTFGNNMIAGPGTLL
mmetsp:Transcript_40894/g.62912  ORF Transcript_40894/g.62912 Transcript_40894/m.62912 type:complete len:249 (+) Transcript_40894:2055-2801(+)